MKLNKKNIFLVIFLSLIFFAMDIYSQNKILDQKELAGVWHNSEKFITFDFEQEKIHHELKTFYGLWKDKLYSTNLNELKFSPLVFENQLFLQYWILDDYENSEKATKLKYFLPVSNILKLSLDEEIIQSEIYGYLFLDSSEVLKIRYWLVDLELDDEVINSQKASITKNTMEIVHNVKLSSLIELDDFYFNNIKKYIKISDKIYTCVEGRGQKIRNVEKILLKNYFSDWKIIEKNNSSFLVLSKPYLYSTID